MAVYRVSVHQLRQRWPHNERLAETSRSAPREADSASAAELLQASTARVEALLAEGGGSAQKTLLAMMYRLAGIEDRLDALAADLQTRKPVFDSPRPAAPTSASPGAKSTVLEQVFRNNQALRDQT